MATHAEADTAALLETAPLLDREADGGATPGKFLVCSMFRPRTVLPS